ncbi:hypothetical protein CEXT_620491, partial [Caerostris extrusa]
MNRRAISAKSYFLALHANRKAFLLKKLPSHSGLPAVIPELLCIWKSVSGR